MAQLVAGGLVSGELLYMITYCIAVPKTHYRLPLLGILE